VRQNVENNRHSLRMFAIVRMVPYVQHYLKSPLAVEFGPIVPHEYARQTRFSPHPHEVYADQKDDIKPCMYLNDLQANIQDCIYDAARFGRASDRPECWPKSWDYPQDPQIANLDIGCPYPACGYCGKMIVSSPLYQESYRGKRCVCTREHYCVNPLPLVEINQYLSYEKKDELLVNRRVRALSPFKEGNILADILSPLVQTIGGLIPPTDSISMGRPLGLRGGWSPSGTPTCVVSSGWNGNWTRFYEP
jgi:hypothetical protein